MRGGHDDHESGQGEPHARPDQPDPTRGDQDLLRGLGHFRGEALVVVDHPNPEYVSDQESPTPHTKADKGLGGASPDED